MKHDIFYQYISTKTYGNNMIHITYSFTDINGTYSQIVGASIASLFCTTNENLTVHLIHDDTLTNENRDNFINLANKFEKN